jgi:hypothetical protein
MLLGLTWPASTHAGSPGTEGSKSKHRLTRGRPRGGGDRAQETESDEEADRPLTEAERQRVLQVLAASIMLEFAQWNSPPDNQPSMVNSLQTSSAGGTPIPAGGPSGGPNTSPEPGSVITGLLGWGLAGLFAYARKRRLRRRLRLELLADVKTDGL